MHDFLIVGGGVIGLSLAWELSQRRKRVCLVDRQQPGQGTSWVGAGIFPPPRTLATHDPMECIRSLSHRLHVEWSEKLRLSTGIDNELHRSGGIYFARRAGEAIALQVEMAQAAAEGVNVENATNQLQEWEPALADAAREFKLAYRLPDEYQLRSPRHLQALRAACEANGVEIRVGCQADDLIIKNNRVVGLSTANPLPASEQYVLCCGPWSAELLAPLGMVLPIEPRRGQLILWKTDAPLVSHVINEGLRYLVPRRDGYLLTGATVEDVGFQCETTDGAVEDLQAYAQQLLPGLSNENFCQAWAGLRPRTPDGLPFMGRVPGFENLSVSAGHFRSGLHLSPAAAQFMADLLLNENLPLEAEAFQLSR